MRTTVTIQNLQCDGCKNAVAIQLNKVEGISNIAIDVSRSSVSFDYSTHNTLEGLRMHLKEIGFPITNDPNRIW
ncbi:heavy-metal-associated domain-containing protein [uncultured Dokdonia sp.]|uniref:heavy-metal-associated domain-containing protein n=1 Tax=uncultured Dokdonia sp. TaxID=575653 RepID=UPI002602EEF9|nr:heavy-metal-associated domain-containing protein [uncultured Dokdonia sp.]